MLKRIVLVFLGLLAFKLHGMEPKESESLVAKTSLSLKRKNTDDTTSNNQHKITFKEYLENRIRKLSKKCNAAYPVLLREAKMRTAQELYDEWKQQGEKSAQGAWLYDIVVAGGDSGPDYIPYNVRKAFRDDQVNASNLQSVYYKILDCVGLPEGKFFIVSYINQMMVLTKYLPNEEIDRSFFPKVVEWDRHKYDCQYENACLIENVFKIFIRKAMAFVIHSYYPLDKPWGDTMYYPTWQEAKSVIDRKLLSETK